MKKTTSLFKDRKQIALLGAILLAGVVLGYWMNDGKASPGSPEPAAAGLLEGNQEESKLYVCPMACVPPMKEPGNCPVCGMALVSTPAPDGTTDIRISQDAITLSGIRTAAVERKFVHADVRLFGKIDYDPAHIAAVSSFMPGVIDRIYVKRPGVFVRWGQPLFDISSTDLLETQKELIEAMKFVPSFYAFQSGLPHVGRDMPVQDLAELEERADTSPEKRAALRKIAALRHKFTLLGLPKRDIDEMMTRGDATGIATLYSYIYGQVIEINANEGTYVNRGATVFSIGDPRHIWARLDAYEADYPWLRKGQEVTFWTDACPGEIVKSKVVYISPVFNSKTRTFTVAALSPDPGGRLKAGMLVRAVIHAELTAQGKVANEQSDLGEAPLVIPASAPLVTGKRAVVYVAVPGEHGAFEGREIVLGPKSADHYIVLAGLKEGEHVVVNGNFKIDSAIQILARSSMMSLPGGHSATEHHHHGGSDLMYEDFQSERMQSRMGPGEEAEEDHDSERVPHVMAPAGPDTKKTEKSFRSTISRRRPGAYGDTTRADPQRPALGEKRRQLK